jgi:hypothetical protein
MSGAWENCSTCEHGHPIDEVCQNCPGFRSPETKYELRKPKPSILDAAKAILTFLEDKGTVEICTGGNSEDPEIFEFDGYGLVAFPDAELSKLQEALSEAIKLAEGAIQNE